MSDKMKTAAEVLVDGQDFYLSLLKMLPEGVTIKDIQGHVTYEFGEPSFKLCNVLLSNGKTIGVEGEHDYPYLTEIPGVSPAQMQVYSGDEATEGNDEDE